MTEPVPTVAVATPFDAELDAAYLRIAAEPTSEDIAYGQAIRARRPVRVTNEAD